MRGLKSFRNNPIILFTASRYLSYSLLFIRGILIAKILGPYLFGIWGFLTLSLQYLTYTSLGIEYAATVELATNDEKSDQEVDQTASVAVTVTFLVAIVLVLLGILMRVLDISLIEKYDLSQYVVEVGIITALTHLNQVFTNIYRVKKKLAKIAFNELLNSVILLIVALNFEGEQLISALLIGMITSGILSLLIYLYNPPFKISFALDKIISKKLLSIGVPLLIFNASFFLIMVSARTILSIFYSVETMGYYSLATAITTATLLGLRSVVWVIFPNILSKTHSGIENVEARKTVENVNILYSTSVFLIVFLLILVLPILFLIIPQYKPAENTIIILLLAQAILSASFGYNSIAIARRRQNQVAFISLLAVVVVIIFSLLAVYFQLPYEWIAMAVLLGSIVYTFFQARLGSDILNLGRFGFKQIDSMISIGSIIAIFCFISGIITEMLMLFGTIGLLIFIFFNRGKLKYIWGFAIKKVWVN